MDELEELQRQLMAVQNEEETHKFSERNIVELMDKLVEIEKLELLHSMNGKEYLTSEHLASEILTELRKAGGRLDIIELPKLLDVSGEHIHKQIDHLIRKDKRRLFAINDALLTNIYLDSLAADIAAVLAERGAIPISEISTTYDLPVDFLKVKFNEWIDGQKIKGKMHGGIIYNDSHIARQKCRVRGYIMSTTRPVAISQAASDLRMEDALFTSLLEDLIRNNEVKAKVQSDLVIPACFERSQKNIVLSFYSQNHYVQYSQLSKIMIRKHKEYLKSLELDGTHLATVFVDNSLISQIDSHVSDTVSSDQVLDLYSQLPHTFTDDDLRVILEHCSSGSKAKLFGHYIAGPKFIESCLESLKSLASKYVPKVEETKKQPKKPSPTSRRKKKGKEEEVHEEEEAKLDLGLTEEVAIKELQKSDKIKKERLDEDDDFLQAFVEHFHADIRELYETAYKEQMKAKLQPKKIGIQQLEGEIQKEFDKLQTAVKSLDLIDKLLEKGVPADQRKKIETMLTTYLVKKQANVLLNYCVVQQLIYCGVDIKEHIKDKQVAALTVQERDKLMKLVPKTLVPVFTELNKYITDRDVRGFVKAITENKAEMAISLRPPDKKADKTLKYTLMQQYKDLIQNESEDLKNVVFNALSMALAENGIMISLPNEVWAIEMMGKIARATGKVDITLIEMVEIVKTQAEYAKINKEERTEVQSKFLEEYESNKDNRITEIKELFKSKE